MEILSLSQNPSLINIINEIHNEPWPEFLNGDEVVIKYWRKLYEIYPQYQFVFKENGEYIGLARVFPIFWNSEISSLPAGFDEAVQIILKNAPQPNVLCALAIVVKKKFAGKGYSGKIIEIVKSIGKKNGFNKLIVPVRPTLKSRYPLIPIENYIEWERNDLPFDPWLRVHIKTGGEILKIANPSMIVQASIQKWQCWTGLYFGESGEYIIAEALNPVQIDIKNDIGVYIEPNVWVLHNL